MTTDMVKLHYNDKEFEVQANTVFFLAQVWLEAEQAEDTRARLRKEIVAELNEFNRKVFENRTTPRDHDIAEIQISMLAAIDIVEGTTMLRDYIRERVTVGCVEDDLDLLSWVKQLIHGDRNFFGVTIQFDSTGDAPILVGDDHNPQFFNAYRKRGQRGPAEVEPGHA